MRYADGVTGGIVAELTVFAYRRLPSVLHKLDARIKLVSLVSISMVTLAAGPLAMAMATGLAVVAFHQTRVPLIRFLCEIKYFLMLLLFVFLARCLTTPGQAVFPWEVLSVSWQGMGLGAMICWRLLVIVVLSMCLTATTSPGHIRGAIEWLLRPVPFIPQRRVGTMIGLMMRFIPVILTRAREISDAQRARGIENRKNPIYRMRMLSMPLLRRTFVTADRLAMAMEARCYGEVRTAPQWKIGIADRAVLAGVVALCVFMLVL